MRKGTRLRLALRDLGSGCAFASMAVSGQLPIWSLVLYGVALVVVLFFREGILAALGKRLDRAVQQRRWEAQRQPDRDTARRSLSDSPLL